MLSLSSLRRMAHSMSLRATGSLIDFPKSSACEERPLRAATRASFRAASSDGGNGGGNAGLEETSVFGLPFGPAALSFAALLFLPLASLSLPAGLSLD